MAPTRTGIVVQVVTDAGVKVIRPDKKPFQEAVRGMKAAYAGTTVGDLLARIEAVE